MDILLKNVETHQFLYIHTLTKKHMTYASKTWPMEKTLDQIKFPTPYWKICHQGSTSYLYYSLPIVINKNKFPNLGKQASQYSYTKRGTPINLPTIDQSHSLTRYKNYSLAHLQTSFPHTEKNTKSYMIVKRTSVPKDAPPDNSKLSLPH